MHNNKISKTVHTLLEKVEQRRRLAHMAHQMIQKTSIAGLPVGVDDVVGPACNGTSVVKECWLPKDAFSCPSGSPYECDATAVYVCGNFSCTLSDFTCNGSLYDHQCGDMFECGNHLTGKDHVCDGKHVFRCADDFFCYDTFTCKNSNRKACTGNYVVDGGKDTTSGDFLCGYPGGNADDFDCNTIFNCETYDDFRCRNSTDFDCGTGDAGDSFTCKKEFQCDGTDFSCNPWSQFHCQSTFQCKKSSPFNCPSYSCPACVTYKDEDF